MRNAITKADPRQWLRHCGSRKIDILIDFSSTRRHCTAACAIKFGQYETTTTLTRGWQLMEVIH